MGYRISLLIGAVFLFSLTSVFSSEQLFTVRAEESIIRVPIDFPTIQAAIDAAPQGAMILVNDGLYSENLHVNKTVNLIGADRRNTIVDGFLNNTVIEVTADNVCISGFTVTNSSYFQGGIVLDHCSGCIVSDCISTLNGYWGIELNHADNNSISHNIFSQNGRPIYFGEGIILVSSSNNTIRDNIVTNSTAYGIVLEESDNNTLFGNTIDENNEAFEMYNSSGNTLFRNNFIRYLFLVTGDYYSNNQWNYTDKGNYWKDYFGLDDGSGDRTVGDGVGDTDLPWHGDYYPLISPLNPIQILWDAEAYPTSLVSNSTVSAFTFDQANKEISFVATGPANTTGYFNVSIPKALLSGSWRITLNQTDATSKSVRVENQTYTTIFLNYNHSSQNIELIGTHVIPEYPTASIFLLAVFLALASTTSIAKKRRR